MHIPCQTLKRARIGKCAHETGRSAPALERFAPVEARGVERFAPGGGAIRSTRQLAHRLKVESRTNREKRARIGNSAHESGKNIRGGSA